MISNLAYLSQSEFDDLRNELAEHKTLGHVLDWAGRKPKNEIIPGIVAEVITQDEFTHDVIVPFRSLFLVYDTT